MQSMKNMPPVFTGARELLMLLHTKYLIQFSEFDQIICEMQYFLLNL